jgi:hypothetical protein
MRLLKDLRVVLTTEAKLLTFRRAKPDMARLGNLYLGFGVLCTWLAGIGRYWDNPRAEIWQHLGLGSLAYIVVLAAFLWLLILPLRPKNWSYKGVLTFVGLTSPPGLLYAIPVERFFSLATGQAINVWFLAVVATWRVALLFLYLKRASALSGLSVIVATLLPLTLIVSALAALNLEHVVFRIMGGLAEDERSANDSAYMALLMLTWFSFWAAPVLLFVYGALSWSRWRDRPAKAGAENAKDVG